MRKQEREKVVYSLVVVVEEESVTAAALTAQSLFISVNDEGDRERGRPETIGLIVTECMSDRIRNLTTNKLSSKANINAS